MTTSWKGGMWFGISRSLMQDLAGLEVTKDLSVSSVILWTWSHLFHYLFPNLQSKRSEGRNLRDRLHLKTQLKMFIHHVLFQKFSGSKLALRLNVLVMLSLLLNSLTLKRNLSWTSWHLGCSSDCPWWYALLSRSQVLVWFCKSIGKKEHMWTVRLKYESWWGRVPLVASRAIFHNVSKLFIADDYRLNPSYNHPFTKSDDEANKRVGVQIHEHLLLLISNSGNSRSKDNKVRTDETKNNSPTKRLGEVDCTRGRII